MGKFSMPPPPPRFQERVGEMVHYLGQSGFELRPDQKRILPKLLNTDYHLLAWEMRTGKTLASAIPMAARYERILVVTLKEVVPSWKKQLKLLREYGDRFTIITVGRLNKRYRKQLKDGDFQAVIVDEIQKFRAFHKSFQTLRSVTDRAECVIGLSGTPFDKVVSEIFYPWQLLDGGLQFGRNSSDFNLRYCYQKNPRRMGDPWVVRPDKIEKIKTAIQGHCDRASPPDLLRPDEKIYKIPVTDAQKRIIHDLAKKVPVPFFRGADADFSAAIRKEKMHQVLSGFLLHTIYSSGPGGKPVPSRVSLDNIPTQKWSYLKNVAMSLSGPVIIWVKYVKEYEIVEKVLEGQGVERFSRAALEKFRNKELKFLICHPRSAGVGIDISCADHAIFVSETPSGIDQAQARARLCKVGSKRKKSIHYLVPNIDISQELRARMNDKKEKLGMFIEKGIFFG